MLAPPPPGMGLLLIACRSLRRKPRQPEPREASTSLASCVSLPAASPSPDLIAARPVSTPSRPCCGIAILHNPVPIEFSSAVLLS